LLTIWRSGLSSVSNGDHYCISVSNLPFFSKISCFASASNRDRDYISVSNFLFSTKIFTTCPYSLHCTRCNNYISGPQLPRNTITQSICATHSASQISHIPYPTLSTTPPITTIQRFHMKAFTNNGYLAYITPRDQCSHIQAFKELYLRIKVQWLWMKVIHT